MIDRITDRERFAASDRVDDGDEPEPGPCRNGTADHRPEIIVRADARHLIADEAESAMVAACVPFYVRTTLVRPVIERANAAGGGSTLSARLVAVSEAAILDYGSRAASWRRFDARAKRVVPANMPREVAAVIASRIGEWNFPRLAGIVTTPTLRRDGSVLSQSGYDPATELLVIDPPPMPAIPDCPTMADAADALDLLDSVLDGFPFVDGASRSVALSALISPVVRGALGTVPMHGINAPVAGSGKSYLVDCAGAITLGDRVPVIAAGRDDIELDKRTAMALLAGWPLFSIDNLNGRIGGDLLCQAVERPRVALRRLGTSSETLIENRACIFATGNNLTPTGDLVRRVVVCHLDPQMEHPEYRQFLTNPYAIILADRGRFVAAALVVVRAYIVAGFPDLRPALASFEDWSRFVRSALVWLGRADPVDKQDRERRADPSVATLWALLEAWRLGPVGCRDDYGQYRWLTAAELVGLAELIDLAGRGLRDALVAATNARTDRLSPKSVSRYLNSHTDRLVDGKCLRKSDERTLRWRLEVDPRQVP